MLWNPFDWQYIGIRFITFCAIHSDMHTKASPYNQIYVTATAESSSRVQHIRLQLSDYLSILIQLIQHVHSNTTQLSKRVAMQTWPEL